MPDHVRRRRFARVAGAAALVTSALVAAAPAPSASALTCKATTIVLSAQGEIDNYETDISTSGVVSTSSHWTTRGPLNVGAPDLTFTTCYSSGKWQLASVSSKDYFSDAKVYYYKDSSGTKHEQIQSNGWGVWTTKIDSTSVSLTAKVCRTTPQSLSALTVLKGVTSLPWPVPYAASVGQYIVSAALPSAPANKYFCGDMATKSFPFSVASNGVVNFSWSKTYFYGQSVSWQLPCSARYCGQTARNIVWVYRVG